MKIRWSLEILVSLFIKYYVSAAGGVVANNSSTYKKYSKSLDYESAEFKFENTIEYSIVNLSSAVRCTVTGLRSSYLPKTDVIWASPL